MGEKLWFSSNNIAYNSTTNARYYTIAEQPWAITIENNWASYKKEIQHFIEEEETRFISNEKTYKGLENSKGWHSLSSRFWGLYTKNSFKEKCPLIYKALNNAPGIVSISLSKLESNTKINKHNGETNAIIRCHLGIEIPTGLPECGINVGGEDNGWEEGKWLFFNDAQAHYAWNNTAKKRIVLIADIIRPQFIGKERMICARVLAEYSFGQRENKFTVIKNLPEPIKKLIIFSTIPAIYIIISLLKFLKAK